MQEPKTNCTEASGHAAMDDPGVSWTLAGNVGAASSSALPDGQYSRDLKGIKKIG